MIKSEYVERKFTNIININDYQVFIDIELSILSLLRYLTDFNDIPLMMADRVL